MRLPDAVSVERHWLVGLAVVVLGHGLGHVISDAGLSVVAGVGGVLLATVGIGGGQGMLAVAIQRERRSWLRPLDQPRRPVRAWMDRWPTDLDRLGGGLLIVALFGFGLALGPMVSGLLPSGAELAVGVGLALLGWRWSRRTR